MGISLEVTIERMTGIRLMPVPCEYPEVPQTYIVCPHCKRAVIPHFCKCDGHVFPADWQCHEHGSVIPMNSAVVNGRPYTPDWSAA